jgi:hypothetical protein
MSLLPKRAPPRAPPPLLVQRRRGGLVHPLEGKPIVLGTKLPDDSPWARDQHFPGVDPMALAEDFLLEHDDLLVHLAIMGKSGSGKSKLIELLGRYFIFYGFPFLFIDPNSDTARNLGAFVQALAEKGQPQFAARFHLIEVGPNYSFGYCPFAGAPLRGTVSRKDYQSWMAARVDMVFRSFMRRIASADQEVMTRLKRWLKNMIWACGVSLDGKNTRLGLDKLLVFTDPARMGPLLDRVFPHLPEEVQSDFTKLMNTKRPIDQENWVASSIGRLRDIMTPVVVDVFARGTAGHSLDVPGIMKQGGFIAAALGRTPRFGFDARSIVGGLLIDELLSSQEEGGELPPEQRIACALIVDEVRYYISEGLEESFSTHRKFRTTVIVGAQDRSTFAQGDLDMADRVLSQAGSVFCFQQALEKERHDIVRTIAAGNPDLDTELMQIVDRPDGHDQITVQDTTRSRGKTRTWNRGKTAQKGRTRTKTRTETEGSADSISDTKTQQHSVARARVQGASQSEATDPAGNKTGRGRGQHGSTSEGVNDGQGLAHAVGHVANRSRSEGESQADSLVRGKSKGEGGSESESESVADKTVLVPRIKTEIHPTGKLRRNRDDQFAWLEQKVHGFEVGEALAKVRSLKKAFFARIADVQEWWASETDKFAAVARLREELLAIHPYLFSPNDQEEMPSLAEAEMVEGKAMDHDPMFD